MTMHFGSLASSTGSCPVCGRDVTMTHAWNGFTLTDRYACWECGETAYALARSASVAAS